MHRLRSSVFFFFNDTAPTEIYTLSLHDALPIYEVLGGPACDLRPGHLPAEGAPPALAGGAGAAESGRPALPGAALRSEEHTSELQSRRDLVCRLLLEKKKKKQDRELRAEQQTE